MRYGVIVCPHCKTVKGVDLSHKTTKCVKCNRVLKIEKLKILYKTDSEEEMRQAIGQINADMNGSLEDFKKMLRSTKFY